MNIDFGWMGKVVLTEVEEPWTAAMTQFKVTHDGFTDSGIRVYAVIDNRYWVSYPAIWQSAILIKI